MLRVGCGKTCVERNINKHTVPIQQLKTRNTRKAPINFCLFFALCVAVLVSGTYDGIASADSEHQQKCFGNFPVTALEFLVAFRGLHICNVKLKQHTHKSYTHTHTHTRGKSRVPRFLFLSLALSVCVFYSGKCSSEWISVVRKICVLVKYRCFRWRTTMRWMEALNLIASVFVCERKKEERELI